MINLPQQIITGLLNGSITRVFEVMEPQPRLRKRQTAQYTTYKYGIPEGVKQSPNPFGEPGTIHTIGGQRFEVVESGVKQYGDISDIDFMEAGYPPETMTGHSHDWCWTAEYRRKDEDE